MAAPHVSAVAALMLEKNPTLSQAQVEAILKGTAIPIPAGLGFSVIFGDVFTWGPDSTGTGLIQADDAVNAVP